MSGVVAVLPVKRFESAKQRVSGTLDSGGRRLLAQAMLSDVLASLRQCHSLARVLVVTGEPAARKLASAFGAEAIDDPRDEGHSEAAMLGCRAAAGRGATAALLVPGDCPLLDPAEIDSLSARARAGLVVVVPDRHGTGTNALLLCPPDAMRPAFGAGSRDRHIGLAEDAGLEAVEVPLLSLALDLDTPEDLHALRARAGEDPTRCPATAETLRVLGTAGVI